MTAPARFKQSDLRRAIKAANIHLRVSNKELLAALDRLVKALSAADDEGLIEFSEDMVFARAAIAKARGLS